MLGEILLGVLSNVLFEGGKAGLGKFLTESPARKAIDATARDFPNIRGVNESLTRWCQSDEFAARIASLNQGSIPDVQESLVDSFIEAGKFYDGLTNTATSARRVLESFSKHLEEELYRSSAGALIEAQRAKARHRGSTMKIEIKLLIVLERTHFHSGWRSYAS